MNIVIILTDITTLGGIERVTSCLSSEFLKFKSEKKINVTVISCFKRYENPAYGIDSSVNLHYLVKDDYNLEKISKYKRAEMIVKAAKSLRNFLKNNKFDTVITQAFLPTFLYWLYGNNVQKHIICEHFNYNLYNFLVTKIRNYIYRKADNIVTLTEADAEKFRAIGLNPISIPNMISVPIKEHSFEGRRLLSVGRLHKQKGYDLLIDAMPAVFKKFPNWQLDIFGEGEERDNLQKKIDSYSLSSNISLKGYTNDVQSELLSSDIFIVSSRYEGFPMIIVEALASGLPVVSFNCPEGPRQLLERGAGLLVEVGNIESLSENIIKLIESRELRNRCRENGYRNIKKYKPEVIMKKWAQLLDISLL